MNKNDINPKILIDTDPGHDDALALLLMIKSNLFEIEAITTVAGNSTIQNCTQNAQFVLNLANSQIPIYSGFEKPLCRDLVQAVVHGSSGLAGADTSKTKYQLKNNAPKILVEIARKNPGITLLTLGPLSNIARALEIEPGLSNLVNQIVMMGGAVNVPGNKNRVAEFNMFVDPEAADMVFNSDLKKVLVPLDACNDVILYEKDFLKIKNQSLLNVLMPLMEHYIEGIGSDEGTKGALVYDALAAYYLINPKAFTTQEMDIVIETQGKHTFGMTVAERRGNKISNLNTLVTTKVDRDKFVGDFIGYLGT